MAKKRRPLPDGRRKLSMAERAEILRRYEAREETGETLVYLARVYGITARYVPIVVAQEMERRAKKDGPAGTNRTGPGAGVESGGEDDTEDTQQ